MQQCPFCMQSVRQCGGIALMTPSQIDGSSVSDPLIGQACVDCMGLIAIVLDGLRGGRIQALAEKFRLSGVLGV